MSKNHSLVISQGCTLRYFGVGVPPGSQYAGPIKTFWLPKVLLSWQTHDLDQVSSNFRA